MKAVIWYYSDIEIAKNYLDMIMHRYALMRLRGKFKNMRDSAEFRAENGDIWKILPCRESFRGVKCNISYVERGTPEEIVRNIIGPCTTQLPYNGIDYYGPYEWEKEEKENNNGK